MFIRVYHTYGNPIVGRLADAEIHFERGVLTGFALSGFTINRLTAGGPLTVSLPSRPYARLDGSFPTGGEYLLMRPSGRTDLERIWTLMVDAYETSRALHILDVPIEDLRGRPAGEDDAGDLPEFSCWVEEEDPAP